MIQGNIFKPMLQKRLGVNKGEMHGLGRKFVVKLGLGGGNSVSQSQNYGHTRTHRHLFTQKKTNGNTVCTAK